MKRRFWHALAISIACMLVAMPVGCARKTHVDLPPPANLDGLHWDRRRPADLDRIAVKALYVLPSAARAANAADGSSRTSGWGGIGSEERSVAVVDLVAVLAEDGVLYMNDVLHEDVPAAYGYGKLPAERIVLRSAQGEITPERKLFSPSEDVLLALDSGYQIDVSVGAKSSRLTFRPAYDADRYRPFEREGRSAPEGTSGLQPAGGFFDSSFDGANGGDGSSGENGQDGKSGKSAKVAGQSGGRGGKGGRGGDGPAGRAGGAGGQGGAGGEGRGGAGGARGEHGGPGERGPAIAVAIWPVYSKFYPDETLVFMDVSATYFEASSGRPYREERKNYILHRRQAFTLTSRGGRGGDGGAGGQGGEGGHGGSGGGGGDGGRGGDGEARSQGAGGDGGLGGRGGDGGHGGSGTPGGNGGPGGDGGRGGDGGEIRASVSGDAAFARDVRAFIRFASIPGEGGARGSGGSPGPAGRAGSGGRGGSGGSGGSGGHGTSQGRSGSSGEDGRSGESGAPGSSSAVGGGDGSPGVRGVAGRIEW